jgi:hypothetical protein
VTRRAGAGPRVGRTLSFRSVDVVLSPVRSDGAPPSGCSTPVLGISAPLLTLAGVNGTPCTTQTAQLDCVSVSGRVTGVFVVFIVVAIAVAIFSLVCQVKIITKAGYSGWYVLTGFVPILGFVMFLIFAFGKWPIQERLERAEQGMGRGYPRPSPYSGMPGPATSGGPPVGPPSGSVVQQPGAAGPGPGPVAIGLQPSGDPGVIYCSWCGKERAVNAQAIHHCGSMDRPAAYCTSCGTPLDGASSCVSCGTPSSKVSR